MSKKKFKKEKDKKDRKEKSSVRSSVLSLLGDMEGKAYSADQLARRLGLKKKSLLKELYAALDQLEEDGQIEQLSNGSFKGKNKAKTATLTGKVDHVNPRFEALSVAKRPNRDASGV